MKSLNLTFKSSLGKTHVLKLNYADQSLQESVVRGAMENIANLHIFVKGDEELYVTPVSAKYLSTTSEPIFTTKKEKKKAA